MKRQLLSPQAAISFASDASGSVGCRAIWPPWWLQYKWSVADRGDDSQLNEDSITLQETYRFCMRSVGRQVAAFIGPGVL